MVVGVDGKGKMINTVEVVAELLTEIGPDLNARGVLQLAEDHWAIIYDEETIVGIRYYPDRHCLTLNIELGSPPTETQLDTYRYLLAYSGLTEQTGGVRIALDLPDSGLLQLYDLFTEDLDRVTLEAVLNNFIATAQSWRKVLRKGLVNEAVDQLNEPTDKDFHEFSEIQA